MGVFIADFGRTIDGLFIYRVNGDKKQIEEYMEELKHLGCEFYDETELEQSWKSHSVLLKIKFPSHIEEEMEKKRAEENASRKKANEQRDLIRSKNIIWGNEN